MPKGRCSPSTGKLKQLSLHTRWTHCSVYFYPWYSAALKWVQERRMHKQNNPLQYVVKENASLNVLGSMKAVSELVMPEIPLRIWCERTAPVGKMTCWTPIFCLAFPQWQNPLEENLWYARWVPVWLVKWSRIQAALDVAVSKGSLKFWGIGTHSPGDKATQHFTHQSANSLLSAFSNVHCIWLLSYTGIYIFSNKSLKD